MTSVARLSEVIGELRKRLAAVNTAINALEQQAMPMGGSAREGLSAPRRKRRKVKAR